MNDVSFLKELQALQQLLGIHFDLIFIKSFQIILFHVDIEINIQQLKHKTSMIPESDMLDHPHNVTFVLGILIHQILEQLGLIHGKLVIQLRIPVNLDRHFTPGLMVNGLYHLRKGSLTQWLNDFISKQDLLTNLDSIVVFIIVNVPHVSILDLLFALTHENMPSKVHLIVLSIIFSDFILLLHGHQVGISFQKFGSPDGKPHIFSLHVQERILTWLLLRHLETITISVYHVLRLGYES